MLRNELSAARQPVPSAGTSHLGRPRRGDDDTLTNVVYRILFRAHTSPRPFAVFLINDALVISNMGTARFESMLRRNQDLLIGSYQRGVTVTQLMQDLGDYFVD